MAKHNITYRKFSSVGTMAQWVAVYIIRAVLLMEKQVWIWLVPICLFSLTFLSTFPAKAYKKFCCSTKNLQRWTALNTLNIKVVLKFCIVYSECILCVFIFLYSFVVIDCVFPFRDARLPFTLDLIFLLLFLFFLFCPCGTQSGRGEIRPQRNWVNSDCVMMLTCICVTCIAHC